jgi:hypothetical protein
MRCQLYCTTATNMTRHKTQKPHMAAVTLGPPGSSGVRGQSVDQNAPRNTTIPLSSLSARNNRQENNRSLMSQYPLIATATASSANRLCAVQTMVAHFEQPPLLDPHPQPPLPPFNSACICCHADIPPDTLETFLNAKTFVRRTVACAERWPDAHTTAMLLVW